MTLIDSLIKEKWLKTPNIIKAFKEIKRADFMPEDMEHLAEFNEAMPIGYGQTISQPLTVAFMLEQLQPKPGQKILDIGSGSGWTTALLSHIVGPKGKVIAIEVVPGLKEFGQKNAAKYNFVEKGIAEFVYADGSKGYKKEAPFDRILVSAAMEEREVPQAWKEQLKVKGRIVVPIRHSIWVLEKKSEKPSTRAKLGAGLVPHRNKVSGAGEFKEKEYPGFAFVPLVQNSGS